MYSTSPFPERCWVHQQLRRVCLHHQNTRTTSMVPCRFPFPLYTRHQPQSRQPLRPTAKLAARLPHGLYTSNAPTFRSSLNVDLFYGYTHARLPLVQNLPLFDKERPGFHVLRFSRNLRSANVYIRDSKPIRFYFTRESSVVGTGCVPTSSFASKCWQYSRLTVIKQYFSSVLNFESFYDSAGSFWIIYMINH